MNKRNLMIVGLMMCSSLFGGNLAPAWVENLRAVGEDGKIPKSFMYQGATWNETPREYIGDQEIHNNNQVKMKYAHSISIFHGLYSHKITGAKENKNYYYPSSKIIIKQKIPCYIVPKHIRYGFNSQAKKLDSHTVEVYSTGEGGNAGFQSTTIDGNTRRGLIGSDGDYKTTHIDVLTKENSTQILGDSFECLKEPNEETWTVYWKLKGDWVLMAREKFYLKP